jgi:voltage-gated potassium channel
MAQFSFRTLLLKLYVAVTDLRWWVLFALLLAHMIGTWLMMHFVGEEPEFARLPTFVYWYATTASTIGYGDVTPKTDVGRLINAFFVYPGAIAIFGAIVTKAIAAIGDRTRRARIGMGDYSEAAHAIVLVGYDPQRTPRMIDELCADAAPGQQIILFTRKEFENNDARIRYVRARSHTDVKDLERAGIDKADQVIVFAGTDSETLAAGLAISNLNRHGHIVCYFEDEATARLLAAHCGNVEVVLAPAVELVVKSVKDPGASALLGDMVSAADAGVTLFSMNWAGGTPISFRALSERLLDAGAVLVSYRQRQSADCHFRYASGEIGPGDQFFYIAPRRLQPAAVGAA